MFFHAGDFCDPMQRKREITKGAKSLLIHLSKYIIKKQLSRLKHNNSINNSFRHNSEKVNPFKIDIFYPKNSSEPGTKK